jgi:hypothetical protein
MYLNKLLFHLSVLCRRLVNPGEANVKVQTGIMELESPSQYHDNLMALWVSCVATGYGQVLLWTGAGCGTDALLIWSINIVILPLLGL